MKLIVRSHERYLPLGIKFGSGAGRSYALAKRSALGLVYRFS
jgi:hypothetical protein